MGGVAGVGKFLEREMHCGNSSSSSIDRDKLATERGEHLTSGLCSLGKRSF